MILDSQIANDCNWYGNDTYLLTQVGLLGKPKVSLGDIRYRPSMITSIKVLLDQ